ncbi:hypothetical protein SA2016_0315 [Sinomonas atrocyanea]|uniref:Protein NO VEIN C-terminal domain-containing protein n=1 Tax=Sinomonas atrocyanea TaxID=37927 RepID=A0A126ZVU6_9MICC|nr:hypothetical protein SA2016_0315 [Sinomonas atrocyanea]GEB63263.1 hypothetical protein SAT01_07110 [Sinomonas atrocyanea]GGG69577.1 hypothetical protein GCM10007172_22140 [Sinomonas atrocyanea]
MTKSACEHWVCSVLSRYGWDTALTRDGLERTDILAVQTEGTDRETIEVQVKSLKSTGPVSSWPISVKAQRPALSQHEWYTLVLLDPDSLSAAPARS